MSLKKRLILSFLFTASLMLAAALFGLLRMQSAVATFDGAVQRQHAVRADIDRMAVDFRFQVQEWKNTLLRGKNEGDLKKHWGSFEKYEASVHKTGEGVLAQLPEGDARKRIEQFIAAHATMGAGYRKALEAFKQSGFDSAVGDKAVHGMDRAPGKLLEEAAADAVASVAAVGKAATQAASLAFMLTLAALCAAAAAAVGVALWIARTVMRQLGADPAEAQRVVTAVAQGDLAQPVALAAGDTTSLMAGLATMKASLSQIMHGVRVSAESVATASAQIAQGNQDLSQRTEEQASALQQTAASMAQLGSTVGNNADSSKQANVLAVGAAEVAERGGQVVGRVVETMKGINDSSKKIADITNVIDSIAFQTNILALNAAVEAARAGEQGRGFAVVAGEVRLLAQRSAEAARQIKDLISDSVGRVEAGTELVEQAGGTMNEIVTAIRRVHGIVGEINTASVEQRTGVAEIGDAVTQMDRTTQQNAALVDESAAAAESLRQQAEQLLAGVSQFRLSTATPA